MNLFSRRPKTIRHDRNPARPKTRSGHLANQPNPRRHGPGPDERKLTKNFHVNFNLLLKLQSLRQPVLAKEKTMTAAA